MKKNRLKNYLKLGVFLFGMTFVFVNCERDDILNNIEQTTTKERQINFLSEGDLSLSILNSLKSKTSNKLSKNYASESSNVENSIDMDNIMQVIDTIGNVNYTFRLNIDDQDDTTFFNLIINESLESEENIPYILKYQIDSNYLQSWIDENYDFAYFTGKVYRYNIDAFFNSYSETSEASFSNAVNSADDCPCDETDINSGTSINSGGGGGSVGSGGSGGGLVLVTTCTSTYTTYQNPCDGANSGDPSDIWGGAHGGTDVPGYGDCSGSTGPTTVEIITCISYYRSNIGTTGGTISGVNEDDCNNPCEGNSRDGDVGVLLPFAKSPCDRMKELANEDTFKGYLTAMKTFASSTDPDANREIANIRKTSDGEYSGIIAGPLNEGEVETTTSVSIDLHMHTHPVQRPESLPVFSAADLYTIYKLFDNDKITNYKDFALTLVTATTTYAIRIKSKTKFLQAFNNFFNIPGDTDAELGIKKLEKIMLDFYKINPNISDAQNELSFVNMLENLNESNGGTGVQFFKANNDFTQWSELEINKFGQVAEELCE